MLPLLWEALEDVLVLLDQEGKIVHVNPAFSRTFGHDAEQMIGRSYLEMAPDDLRDQYAAEFEATVSGKLSGSLGEGHLMHSDGRMRLVSMRHSRLAAPGCQPLHALLLRDITLEQTRRARWLQDDRMRSLGTLAGGVAHEFNNLLVSILGYAEMIMEADGSSNEVGSRAAKIRDAALRGRRLTSKLLPFSTEEEEDHTPRSMDLLPVLTEVAAMFLASQGSRVEVVTDIPDEAPPVKGNRLRLQQVFLNLLLNAGDAMPSGGRIHLRARAFPPDGVTVPASLRETGRPVLEVVVEDEGGGMDSAVLRRIFDPFFTTSERQERPGLGMALVYSVVKNHGGEVTVQSRRGIGSTVSIFLPAARE